MENDYQKSNIDLLYDFCEKRREALKVHPDNQTEEQRALIKVEVVPYGAPQVDQEL